MAKVALEGIQFYAYHGFYEEERRIGNHYELDIYIDTQFFMAASHDDLSGTINYETVYQICKIEMKKPSKLLEHVAQRILNKLSDQFSSAGTILVRLSKMNPPLGGRVMRAFVEVSSGGGAGKLANFMDDDEDDMRMDFDSFMPPF